MVDVDVTCENKEHSRLITEYLHQNADYVIANFKGELVRKDCPANDGILGFKFTESTIEDLNALGDELRLGQEDIVMLRGRNIELPKHVISKLLRTSVRKAHLVYKEQLSLDDVLFLVEQERAAQEALAHGGDTDSFDEQLSANDFIALAMSYLGRASQKSFRNKREKQSYRENIIKAMALLASGLEHEKSALTNGEGF